MRPVLSGVGGVPLLQARTTCHRRAKHFQHTCPVCTSTLRNEPAMSGRPCCRGGRRAIAGLHVVGAQGPGAAPGGAEVARVPGRLLPGPPQNAGCVLWRRGELQSPSYLCIAMRVTVQSRALDTLAVGAPAVAEPSAAPALSAIKMDACTDSCC